MNEDQIQIALWSKRSNWCWWGILVAMMAAAGFGWMDNLAWMDAALYFSFIPMIGLVICRIKVMDAYFRDRDR